MLVIKKLCYCKRFVGIYLSVNICDKVEAYEHLTEHAENANNKNYSKEGILELAYISFLSTVSI